MSYNNNDFPWRNLQDQTILNIYRNEDSLVFPLANGKIYVATFYSDCCSETWIGDILGVQFLANATVNKIEYLYFPEEYVKTAPAHVFDDARGHQESETYFGVALHTNNGTCTFVFRNSSNGYYGGSCNDLTERTKLTHTDVLLTEDYSG